MAVFIAALGNDPAPVMQGFLEAQVRAGVQEVEVYLLIEGAETNDAKQRRPKLQDWLSSKKAVLKGFIQIGTLSDTFRAVSALFFSIAASEKVFVDATGGTKLLSVALFNQAQIKKSVLYTQNVHGNGQVLTLLPQYDTTQMLNQITLDDYLAVYSMASFETVEGDKHTQEFLEQYGFKTNRVVVFAAKKFAIRLRGTRLEVLLLEAVSDGKFEAYTLLRDFATRVGGGSAAACAYFERPNPEWVLKAQLRNVRILSPKRQPNPQPQPIVQPPKLPSSIRGKTLIAFASGQTIPVIQTYSSHDDIENVVLLASTEMLGSAARLTEYFVSRKINVILYSSNDLSPNQPQDVFKAIQSVLAVCQAEVVVNLNGGTAAMAMVLWQALAQHQQPWQADYVDDNSNYHFFDLTKPLVARSFASKATIAEHMALYGVQFKPQAFRANKELLTLAEGIAVNASPLLLHEFAQLFATSHGQTLLTDLRSISGKAREYYFYFMLQTLFPEIEFSCGGELQYLKWNNNTKKDEFICAPNNKPIHNQIDVIMRYENKLILIEIKPNIEEAISIKNREHLHTPMIAERVGGRFARSMIITSKTYKDNSHDTFPRQLDEAIEHIGTREWLSLWAVDRPDDLCEKINKFPEDFLEYIDKI